MPYIAMAMSPPNRAMEASIVAPMAMTPHQALSKPSEKPERMSVAAPVWDAAAISRTGLPSMSV